jgi:hypothetical protein
VKSSFDASSFGSEPSLLLKALATGGQSRKMRLEGKERQSWNGRKGEAHHQAEVLPPNNCNCQIANTFALQIGLPCNAVVQNLTNPMHVD